MPAKKEKFLKTGDVVVLLSVVAAVIVLWLVYAFVFQKPSGGGTVEITVGGELFGTYALSEDRTLVVPGVNGGENTVVFENGQVHVQAASCPDHLCVRQGQISHRGQSVVCLPNGLVITVKEAPAGDVDITI